jgi:A/G-specific adenine glycosylase
MQTKEIARRLADWHAVQQRDLPWRNMPAGRRDPYAVWVSEIMAQQTRLATVEEYYTRWMERFPTARSVAEAELQDVLKAWEGLGYYARARNLHRAAQVVTARYGGELPLTREELLGLPGIGEYTAGAILSLSAGQHEPVLDGNVKRVFSRLADMTESVDGGDTMKGLWAMARALVEAAPDGQAGAVNEGLMELGATVCTPRAPRCMLCPVQGYCEAFAKGTQEDRPVRSARRTTPHYDVTAGVIWEGEPLRSRLLIAQRPLDGMLGGLWEFPGGKLEAGDPDLAGCLRREIDEELGIEIEVLERVATVRHAYTHFRITLHAFHARRLAGNPQPLGCADWRWAVFDELAGIPFPVTDQKIVRALKLELVESGEIPT